MATAKPTVVLLPVWASGHFMPALEAAKRLGADFSLTVLVMRPPTPESASEVAAHVARESSCRVAARVEVTFLHLPAVDPPSGCATVEEFTSRYIHLQEPLVGAALPPRAAALVVEFTSTTMFDVARDLGLPAYVYFASSAAMLALMLRLPALQHEVPTEFGEMEGHHVHVPGLPPVPASLMPASVMSKKSPSYADTLYHGGRLAEAAGIIVNTAAELEPAVVAAIAEGQCTPGRSPPPLYPIGPVISSTGARSDGDHECLRWLDGQPQASVLFVCFGSLGFLGAAQVREVTAGLERSGHRFLWVLRTSPAAGCDASSHLRGILPEGFLERTAARGLVRPAWALQREVLAHAAVGGFVTHCGWNSVLEAVWSGVPMAPWPLYAEQHLNAFELVAAMGVAVRMEVNRKRSNFVEAGELERAVRCLMEEEEEEGRRARERAAEAMAACRKAVDAGGSSDGSLCWRMRVGYGSKNKNFYRATRTSSKGCDHGSLLLDTQSSGKRVGEADPTTRVEVVEEAADPASDQVDCAAASSTSTGIHTFRARTPTGGCISTSDRLGFQREVTTMFSWTTRLNCSNSVSRPTSLYI